MCPPGDYYTLMRESKDPNYLRLQMVLHARREGLEPTARAFQASPSTVRKWLRRFDGTLVSLAERSRAPQHHPKGLKPEQEAEILRVKRRLRPCGARKLKALFRLPYAVKTIRRVCRKHGLARRWRRKKHQTKRCLREIKRHWALWQRITVDTKDMVDLPEYWLQAKLLGLPRYQYTAREVSTGALFLAWADELSRTYSELLAQRLATHLATNGVRLSQVTVRTDNGSEFVGSWQATRESAFTLILRSAGAHHRTIPPGQHRYQADVETVHGLMEYEFYLERFRSRADFLAKAATYQNFFNYLWPNSGKENKCPWELVQEKCLSAKPELLYLPPVFLNEFFQQRLHGQNALHNVGVLPSI